MKKPATKTKKPNPPECDSLHCQSSFQEQLDLADSCRTLTKLLQDHKKTTLLTCKTFQNILLEETFAIILDKARLLSCGFAGLHIA